MVMNVVFLVSLVVVVVVVVASPSQATHNIRVHGISDA